MTQIQDLHDSTFERLSFDWEQSRLQLFFGPVDGSGQPEGMAVTGLREFQMTKKNPWGPSIYVNGGEVVQESELQRVRIEMQSGDLLDFLCESWKFEWTETNHANA